MAKRENMKWYFEIADTKADEKREEAQSVSIYTYIGSTMRDFTHIDNFRFGTCKHSVELRFTPTFFVPVKCCALNVQNLTKYEQRIRLNGMRRNSIETAKQRFFFIGSLKHKMRICGNLALDCS